MKRGPKPKIDRWLWSNWNRIHYDRLRRETHKLLVRKTRAGIKRLDDASQLERMRFFDGYDGPPRQPKNYWPIIIEQGQKFGNSSVKL